MLLFVLAGDEARTRAAARPSGLKRVRGTAAALSTDLVSSAWEELTRVGNRAHEPGRRKITEATPLWAGTAKMSLEDARVAASADRRLTENSLGASLGGDQTPISGKLEIFDDHMVMNTFDHSPVDPFALHPHGDVSVVGVVDGNPGDAAFVLALRSGRLVTLRLGRARGLAAVLGTLPPAP